MKQLSLLVCALLISMSSMAQMYLWQDGKSTLANLDSITFLSLADIDIEISSSTLSLGVGYTARLVARLIPVGANATVVWSSDNEEVATVKAGIVTGVAEGQATITATTGIAKATCVVTVVSAEELAIKNFSISDWGLFGKGDMIPGTEKYIAFTSGDSAKCQLGYASVYFWDEGLTFVHGIGFRGAGFIGTAEVPIYWIIEGKHAGFYVGSGGFWIEDFEGDYKPYTARAGKLVSEQKYGDFFKGLAAYMEDTTQKPNRNLYEEAFEGVQMYMLDADKKTESYNVANVKAAKLLENQDDSKNYVAEIEWFDFFNADRYFGLKATFDTSGNLKSIVEPYDIRRITKKYTDIEETSEVNSAAQIPSKLDNRAEENTTYFIGDPKRLHLNDEAVQKQLSTLKLNKK